ncbi:hypothetical protein L1049_007090 [Liquidambar formosana]|uniref:Neprosin PEP catalytic domain-containing protein n=1 Tax=Liquidambar formosana TaxID=63359 RepID=A0AAP0RGM0_LIQFO
MYQITAMAFRAVLIDSPCSLLLGNNGVEGSRKLSRKEELDLEKQIKLLNKPAIKTIPTEYGEIYDCVDFYKQPAFDHPLLKNHTFHNKTRPASPPQWTRDRDLTTVGRPLSIGLKGGGCPNGTAPIRRTTKDDLIRAKLFSERLKSSNINPINDETLASHYAVVRTSFDRNKKYKGVGASMSIYNPQVTGLQLSSGQIKIQNDQDYIQFGWTVNPNIYDNHTRPFTFFSEDISGNWWLEGGPNHTKIGFWPRRIFTGLADLATHVEWGGEVISVPGLPSPPMGSGQFPAGDTSFDALCGNIVIVNETNSIVPPENTLVFEDDDKFYKVKDMGDTQGHLRPLVLFGGPGGII